eukprot:2346024-Ditylum_brightwellii.AAC.1
MGGDSSGGEEKPARRREACLGVCLLVASKVVVATMRKQLPSKGGFPPSRVNVVGLERTWRGEQLNL